MSCPRNFRITVNLSNFFYDHRTRARIFINDDIETISDLEFRIKTVFDIDNFHLISQNEYLPPEEDVRILQGDDIIWVMRNSYESEYVPQTGLRGVSDTNDINENNKRCIIDNSYVLAGTPPPKKKKKNYEQTFEQETKPTSISKKEHMKKQICDCNVRDGNINSKINENTSDDQNMGNNLNNSPSHEIFSSGKDDTVQVQSNTKNKSINVSSYFLEDSPATSMFKQGNRLSELFSPVKKPGEETVLSSYKKNKPIPTITNKYLQGKKVNIVKIEHLSGSSLQIKQLDCDMDILDSEHASEPNYSTTVNKSTVIHTIPEKLHSDEQKNKTKSTSIVSLPSNDDIKQHSGMDITRNDSCKEIVMYNGINTDANLKEVLVNKETSNKIVVHNEAATNTNNSLLDNPDCNYVETKSEADYQVNISKQNDAITETANDNDPKIGKLGKEMDLFKSAEDNDLPTERPSQLVVENQNEVTAMVAIMNLGESSVKNCDVDLTRDTTTPLDESFNGRLCDRPGNSSLLKRKQLSGLGQILGHLRSDESTFGTGDSLDSDCSQFITKRHRKRTHRRRKRNNENYSNTSLDDTSITASSNISQKYIRTEGCPLLHIKFEGEDEEVLERVDVLKNRNDSEKGKESYTEVENITISDGEVSCLEVFNFNEEHIRKSPSMKDLLPKVGDIIAFKILRMTENYAPEISSHIIGKVLDYDRESKTVLYLILKGTDQCVEPKGNLTIELEENGSTKSNKREFFWTDIITPKLLYP